MTGLFTAHQRAQHQRRLHLHKLTRASNDKPTIGDRVVYAPTATRSFQPSANTSTSFPTPASKGKQNGPRPSLLALASASPVESVHP